MRGFSDEERAAIREDLVRTGREQFLRWGPEKTTVRDITDEVSIAKSTFYRFFDSKAELYFEILVRERDAFLDELTTLLDGVDDAETGLRTLFDVYLDWLEESPLLQELVIEPQYVDLYRDVPADELQGELRVTLETLTPFLDAWQADGDMRSMDTYTFFGLMKVAGLLPFYRDDFESFDEGWYDEIRAALLDTLTAGLTT